MSPKLWPPLGFHPFRRQKKIYINISLEPVLRQGGQNRKMVLTKKGFQGMLSIFYILPEKNFSGRGVDLPPPLIEDALQGARKNTFIGHRIAQSPALHRLFFITTYSKDLFFATAKYRPPLKKGSLQLIATLKTLPIFTSYTISWCEPFSRDGPVFCEKW